MKKTKKATKAVQTMIMKTFELSEGQREALRLGAITLRVSESTILRQSLEFALPKMLKALIPLPKDARKYVRAMAES